MFLDGFPCSREHLKFLARIYADAVAEIVFDALGINASAFAFLRWFSCKFKIFVCICSYTMVFVGEKYLYQMFKW